MNYEEIFFSRVAQPLCSVTFSRFFQGLRRQNEQFSHVSERSFKNMQNEREEEEEEEEEEKNTENIRISQTFRSSLTVLHLSLIFGFEMSASLRFFNF